MTLTKSVSITSIIALLIIITLAMLIVPKAHAAQCSGKPSVPGTLTATPGPGKGQVTLKWSRSTNIDRYDVVFGNKSGTFQKDYQFGGLNIGNENSSSYTVNFLGSKVKYYFRLSTTCGGSDKPASLSQEVSAIAK